MLKIISCLLFAGLVLAAILSADGAGPNRVVDMQPVRPEEEGALR